MAKKRTKKTAKRSAPKKAAAGIQSYSYDQLMKAAEAKKQQEIDGVREELAVLRREFAQRERELVKRLAALTGQPTRNGAARAASASRRTTSSGGRSARGAVRNAVLSGLAKAGGQSTVSDIMKHVEKVTTGNPRAAVSVQLNSLSKAELVTKGGARGVWKLTAAGKKQAVPIKRETC